MIFDKLKATEYLGRVILIGRMEGDTDVIAYVVTGRSPSSQARRLVKTNTGLKTEPTNKGVLETGNRDLLIYNAVTQVPNTDIFVVSNGAQTDL